MHGEIAREKNGFEDIELAVSQIDRCTREASKESASNRMNLIGETVPLAVARSAQPFHHAQNAQYRSKATWPCLLLHHELDELVVYKYRLDYLSSGSRA